MQNTNVIGYFNPNEYPLQLSLAEHNMVIQLEPKQYIIDRTGRMVNDPVLDRFVGKGRLARATDQKQRVEITFLRPVSESESSRPPDGHRHSVSQASRFDVKDGQVVAVNPVSAEQQTAAPRPSSYNPVRGMTVEQAAKLRLIKPTRIVPEDYGAEESTGAPKSGQEIPPIMYATDSVRGRKPTPLPAELAQPANAQQAAIIKGLEQASATNPESPNILSYVSGQAIAESAKPSLEAANVQGIPNNTVFPKPQLDPLPSDNQGPATAQGPVRLTAPPVPANPTPTVITPLPTPTSALGGPGSSIVVEEELPDSDKSQVDTSHDVGVEDRVESAIRPVPPPPPAPKITPVKCPLCKDKSFATTGLFLRHVRRYHPESEAELMAPYASA